MRRAIYMFVAALAVVVSRGDEPTKPKPKDHSWLTKHAVIVELHARHNAERARVGLPKLELDPEMCLAAQRHATVMSTNGWFFHSGLPYRENIFMGVYSAEAAVNGWIWSPAHHGNMLSGTKAGYGYQYLNGHASWVGLFQ